MTFSSICRSIRRFYFNYHRVESPSLYLYSPFTRRLQFALRLVITFLLASFIGYATTLRDHLGQVYMIPNIGVLCIQETFGLTLFNSLHVTFVVVPLSIFLYIVQKIGLSYHNYLAGELLMLFSSFCISYQSRKMKSRKLALWFNAIFFVTIINEQTVRTTFAFELLADFLLGMCVALAVSLLIFPLFATFDIENRVNYCLLHIDQMHTLLLQAFLCRDQTAARVSLAQAAIVERRLRETMNKMHGRLNEARLEPSQFLQNVFNRKRRAIIDLTIDEQADLITVLMFHVCSMQAMVTQCSFNKYHNDLVDEIQTHFADLTTCQSLVISRVISSDSMSRETFNTHINNLQIALDSLNAAYKQVRLHRIEDVLHSGIKTQSEDHLSHTFFFFQLGAIVRLLAQATVFNSARETSRNIRKRKSWKHIFKFELDWSRIFSGLKSMFIIGVGSIFVMVPSLANSFANGQWILVGLCMTQGDTVGGAFTTMRRRLVGTLFGSIWAYAAYKAVGEDPFKIFGMFVPWLLIFGYLRLSPQWDYAATVAASTPIVINLGRLYGDVYRQGNFVLLRIQETLIGMALGVFLTLLIFPIFAVDLLKANIQDTLKTCRRAIESIHSIYDQFFQHQHSQTLSNSIDEQEEMKVNIDLQRKRFQELISSQRTLVKFATSEPSFWWFNYGFSASRYKNLVQEQLDMFRMLHNMHATLIYINECSLNDQNQIEDLRLNAAGGRFLPDLHKELTTLSRQLNNCVDLWTAYMTLTKTTHYRWSRIYDPHRKKELIKGDLSDNQQSLIELHRTVLRLQGEHQQAMNQLLDFYIEKSAEGKEVSTFVPYVNSNQAESIFVAISAMYYSTIQLTQAAMELGTTIHTIFELETTTVFRYF